MIDTPPSGDLPRTGGDRPLFSVITATHNLIRSERQESFERVIACLRTQHATAFEHIIQDGGSDDGTQAFVAKVTAGLNWVRFESRPDRSLYDGMNIAAARSSGEYLLFLNSDDSLASSDLMARTARRLRRQRPDFAYGGTAWEEDTGQRIVSARTNMRAVLQRMPFGHNSVFIRRDVFHALGGHDIRYRIAADYDLILRMIATGYHGLALDDTVSLYWARGASADDTQVGREYARIWQAFFARFLPELPSVETFETCYRQGHMPAALLLRLLRTKGLPRPIAAAARHSLGKSLRRALQPWRK